MGKYKFQLPLPYHNYFACYSQRTQRNLNSIKLLYTCKIFIRAFVSLAQANKHYQDIFSDEILDILFKNISSLQPLSLSKKVKIALNNFSKINRIQITKPSLREMKHITFLVVTYL